MGVREERMHELLTLGSNQNGKRPLSAGSSNTTISPDVETDSEISDWDCSDDEGVEVQEEAMEVQDWESDDEDDVPAPPLMRRGSPGRTEFFNVLFQDRPDHEVGPEEPVVEPGTIWDDWDDDETPIAIAAQKAKDPWAASSFWDDWDEDNAGGAPSGTAVVVHV